MHIIIDTIAPVSTIDQILLLNITIFLFTYTKTVYDSMIFLYFKREKE